jgi:hypothetical protein
MVDLTVLCPVQAFEGSLQKITRLELHGVEVAEPERLWPNLTGVRHITLYDMPLSSEVINHLLSFPELKSLALAHMPLPGYDTPASDSVAQVGRDLAGRLEACATALPCTPFAVMLVAMLPPLPLVPSTPPSQCAYECLASLTPCARSRTWSVSPSWRHLSCRGQVSALLMLTSSRPAGWLAYEPKQPDHSSSFCTCMCVCK